MFCCLVDDWCLLGWVWLVCVVAIYWGLFGFVVFLICFGFVYCGLRVVVLLSLWVCICCWCEFVVFLLTLLFAFVDFDLFAFGCFLFDLLFCWV